MQIAAIICLSIAFLTNLALLIFHNKGEGRKTFFLVTRIISVVCLAATLVLLLLP